MSKYQKFLNQSATSDNIYNKWLFGPASPNTLNQTASQGKIVPQNTDPSIAALSGGLIKNHKNLDHPMRKNYSARSSSPFRDYNDKYRVVPNLHHTESNLSTLQTSNSKVNPSIKGSQSVRQLRDTQPTDRPSLQREASDQAIMNKWKDRSSQISMRGVEKDQTQPHRSSRNLANLADPMMGSSQRASNVLMDELVRQKSEVFATDPSKDYRKNVNNKGVFNGLKKNSEQNQRLAKYYQKNAIKQGGRGLTSQTQRKNEHQYEYKWKGAEQVNEHNAYVDIPPSAGGLQTSRKNEASYERSDDTVRPTKK